MFDLLLSTIPSHRTERIIDMSQATIYSQMTTEGRRRLWNGWMRTITDVAGNLIRQDALEAHTTPLFWNGVVLSIDSLKRKFFETWGKGSIR